MLVNKPTYLLRKHGEVKGLVALGQEAKPVLDRNHSPIQSTRLM